MRRPKASLVAELLPLRPQGFLIEYGNPDGHDLDLFCVVREVVTLSWVLGSIDLHLFPVTTCERLIHLLDAAVVEPLAEGQFVDGDRSVYEQLTHQLNSVTPTREAGFHHLQRSVSELNRAAVWLEEFNVLPSQRNALGTLTSLSYSTSYIDAARRILVDHKRPKRFKDLKLSNRGLQRILNALADVKNGSIPSADDLKKAVEWTAIDLAGFDSLDGLSSTGPTSGSEI